jgi:MYXO-CTERM domain-containing protein
MLRPLGSSERIRAAARMAAVAALILLLAPTAASPDVDPVPFVALFGAIGALGLLVWRTRRPPIPPTGLMDLP